MPVHYIKKTKSELVQLAQDLFDEKIFMDRQIAPEDTRLFGAIFMPLSLMNDTQLRELKEFPLGMMYEYKDKAGPRTINDKYPIFMSLHILDLEDTEKMLEYLKIFKARENG